MDGTKQMYDDEPMDAITQERVRRRIEELVAMGYEQMLRERLVTHRPNQEKSRLRFLLL